MVNFIECKPSFAAPNLICKFLPVFCMVFAFVRIASSENPGSTRRLAVCCYSFSLRSISFIGFCKYFSYKKVGYLGQPRFLWRMQPEH